MSWSQPPDAETLIPDVIGEDLSNVGIEFGVSTPEMRLHPGSNESKQVVFGQLSTRSVCGIQAAHG
jgi:hypothetical protein